MSPNGLAWAHYSWQEIYGSAYLSILNHLQDKLTAWWKITNNYRTENAIFYLWAEETFCFQSVAHHPLLLTPAKRMKSERLVKKEKISISMCGTFWNFISVSILCFFFLNKQLISKQLLKNMIVSSNILTLNSLWIVILKYVTRSCFKGEE